MTFSRFWYLSYQMLPSTALPGSPSKEGMLGSGWVVATMGVCLVPPG
jgi:hypothetical protein